MNLSEVLPHFNNRKAELARALGITRQAITSWRDGEIPEAQELKLRYEILPALEAGERRAAR